MSPKVVKRVRMLKQLVARGSQKLVLTSNDRPPRRRIKH